MGQQSCLCVVCLRRIVLFRLFYNAESLRRKLDLEVRLQCKTQEFSVEWYCLVVSATTPTKDALV